MAFFHYIIIIFVSTGSSGEPVVINISMTKMSDFSTFYCKPVSLTEDSNYIILHCIVRKRISKTKH